MECHHAARRAVEFGYKDVFIMPDGIDGWVKSGKKASQGDDK